jgi:hypothetical protein
MHNFQEQFSIIICLTSALDALCLAFTFIMLILHVIRVDFVWCFMVAPPQFQWVEGGGVFADTLTLKSARVKWRFSERRILYLTLVMRSLYTVPSAKLRLLMALNVHQVTAGKRLKSHNEQLMFIIPVIGRYNIHRYCDRWMRTKPSWVAPHWTLLDGREEQMY